MKSHMEMCQSQFQTTYLQTKGRGHQSNSGAGVMLLPGKMTLSET